MKLTDVQFAVLFGSHAKGYAQIKSDTDIAVLTSHKLSLEEKMNLSANLAIRLNISEDKIDLVDLWNASPLLQHEIAESGKLIYGEPFAFLRFRILAWKRYLDTAKFRRLGEQQLKSYAERSHTT